MGLARSALGSVAGAYERARAGFAENVVSAAYERGWAEASEYHGVPFAAKDLHAMIAGRTACVEETLKELSGS